MPRFILYILFIMLSGCHIMMAQELNDSVFNKTTLGSFLLHKVRENKTGKLELSAFNKPVLFIFLSPECPLSQNYSVILNELFTEYKTAVSICGIFPGYAYKAKQIEAFAKKYHIQFPVFIDRKKALTNYLCASITPEVILLNNNGLLAYRGAIDNRMKELGVKRVQVTEHYLKDALGQIIQNKDVSVKRVNAVGCLINEY